MRLLEPNKKKLGERSQAYIIARLLDIGYEVLLPYGDSSRYDLVIEDADGKFWRVQCKTAYMDGGRDGYMQFSTASLRSRQGDGRITYSRRSYAGEVDYFAVYNHDLKKAYLIPAELCTGTRMNLRLHPPKNGMKKGIHFAEEFEI